MKLYAAKFSILLVTLLCHTFLVSAQVPAYYNGTDMNKTGNSLKTELATLITQTHTTELSYTPGVWEALKQTDLDPDNPIMYCCFTGIMTMTEISKPTDHAIKTITVVIRATGTGSTYLPNR